LREPREHDRVALAEHQRQHVRRELKQRRELDEGCRRRLQHGEQAGARSLVGREFGHGMQVSGERVEHSIQ